jgi:hypothetical protein
MTDEQNKNLENSESEVIDQPTDGSAPAIAAESAPPLPLARRSPGPRTHKGKERSKRNSTKHGIFSQVVVLPDESRAEFNALLRAYYDDRQPVGRAEEDLVQILAVTRWQQRRMFIAQAAEIQAQREFIEWDEAQRQVLEADKISLASSEVGLIRKIANPEVLQRCLDLLGELTSRIDRDDFGTQGENDILSKLYVGFENDGKTLNLWQKSFFDSYFRLLKSRKEGTASATEYRNEFLEEITEELKRLERYKQERASIESKRMALESLRRSVPDSPRLDKWIRYAAHLERTFERAASLLERTQRMRLGQPVAPRIDVNVSSS